MDFLEVFIWNLFWFRITWNTLHAHSTPDLRITGIETSHALTWKATATATSKMAATGSTAKKMPNEHCQAAEEKALSLEHEGQPWYFLFRLYHILSVYQQRVQIIAKCALSPNHSERTPCLLLLFSLRRASWWDQEIRWPEVKITARV